MGDRYTITVPGKKLEERFKVDVTERYKPRYNAAPTQVLPIITQGSQGISFFYWGQIPDWSKNRSISDKLIYAEAESINQKTSTRKPFLAARCIVPADGFYGWKQIAKKRKIPYRFIFGDEEIRSFPAIWEEFEDDEGNEMHTFRILNITANKVVQEVMDRMPVIFEAEQEDIWLSDTKDEEALTEMLTPYSSDKIGSYTVSPRIASLDIDEPSLIKPFAAADQFGNYSLFD
ncbi:MAG: SOS response-associated peptidase [Fulvivirga sp.]|nr:SOS response-associated peptidase [Fulvivirga sp.]